MLQRVPRIATTSFYDSFGKQHYIGKFLRNSEHRSFLHEYSLCWVKRTPEAQAKPKASTHLAGACHLRDPIMPTPVPDPVVGSRYCNGCSGLAHVLTVLWLGLLLESSI